MITEIELSEFEKHPRKYVDEVEKTGTTIEVLKDGVVVVLISRA
jgi:prevent-host-death family protein